MNRTLHFELRAGGPFLALILGVLAGTILLFSLLPGSSFFPTYAKLLLFGLLLGGPLGAQPLARSQRQRTRAWEEALPIQPAELRQSKLQMALFALGLLALMIGISVLTAASAPENQLSRLRATMYIPAVFAAGLAGFRLSEWNRSGRKSADGLVGSLIGLSIFVVGEGLHQIAPWLGPAAALAASAAVIRWGAQKEPDRSGR